MPYDIDMIKFPVYILLEMRYICKQENEFSGFNFVFCVYHKNIRNTRFEVKTHCNNASYMLK